MGAFCSFCPRVVPPRTRSTSRSYERIVDQDPAKIKINQQHSSSTTISIPAVTATTANQIQMKINPIPPSKPESAVLPLESKVVQNLPQPIMNNLQSSAPKSIAQTQIGFAAKYELKDVIGVGSTSTCHRCIKKSDGKEFACKVIDKRQVEVKYSGLLEQFNVEIKVLKMLKHPNIISLADTYETADKIYMVMEMMVGGELFDYVVEKGTLNEEEASVLVRKITSAVAHMHAFGVIHRDLKPENLLLTSKAPNAEVKIIDFGLAKVKNNATADTIQARSFLGTRGYLAPEMLQRHSYDKAIDVWALGVIVFVLLCGCLPFDDDSSKIETDHDARLKFALRFPKWSTNLSESAKDLLKRLLTVDPHERCSAEEALRHPWVVGKMATPNNYLQSPSVLGRNRKESRSPMTPRMQAARSKIAVNGQVAAVSGLTQQMSQQQQRQRTANRSRNGNNNGYEEDGKSNTGHVRKNSI